MRRQDARALEAVDQDLARLGRVPVTRRDVTLQALAFLRAVGKPLRKIARDDVRSYLATRRAAGLGLRGQVGYLSRLRTLFGALVRLRLASLDPTEGLTLPRPTPRPYLLLSEQDVARLLAAALDVSPDDRLRFARARRDRAALELLYGLGLRSAELRAARVMDLDLTTAQLLVRRAKRGQPERLPLPPASVPDLRAYLDARPLLARGEDEGRLLVRNDGRPYAHASGICKLVGRVAQRAGVAVHPHALRRGVATHLVRAGASVVAVQHLLGHAELNTTAIYVRVDRDDLRRAIDTLDREPPPPGGGTPGA